MSFKITKTNTREYEILDYKKSMFVYDDKFIKIRSRLRTKMNTCFICNKKLIKDEPFALLFIKSEKNKVAHNECVDLNIKK